MLLLLNYWGFWIHFICAEGLWYEPSKSPTNHWWITLSKKVFQWPLKEATEAKNKSDQKSSIFKSHYKCHIWGLQKCKNYSKIPIRRGCIGVKIHHLQYCGLNGFQTDFTKWPFLRPNWGWSQSFLPWSYLKGFGQCLSEQFCWPGSQRWVNFKFQRAL